MKEYCRVLEVGGLSPAIQGMRLPTKSGGDSDIYDVESYFDFGVSEYHFTLGEKDERLAKNLLGKGNVHGKFQRSITAWLDINMPRYIWSELDTYSIGVAPTSSESTMYTLRKEGRKGITNDMFTDWTPQFVIDQFRDNIGRLESIYGGINEIPIQILKSCLPEGWMQRRIKSYSYQALKGIYQYRYNHKLPEWKTICEAIESLPYFEELLIGCKKEDFQFD